MACGAGEDVCGWGYCLPPCHRSRIFRATCLLLACRPSRFGPAPGHFCLASFKSVDGKDSRAPYWGILDYKWKRLKWTNLHKKGSLLEYSRLSLESCQGYSWVSGWYPETGRAWEALLSFSPSLSFPQCFWIIFSVTATLTPCSIWLLTPMFPILWPRCLERDYFLCIPESPRENWCVVLGYGDSHDKPWEDGSLRSHWVSAERASLL